MTHTKAKPKPKRIKSPNPERQQGQATTSRWLDIWKCFAIISLVITIAGFVFLIYPRLSVHPGEILNPDNPFENPFIINNNGYIPIANIRYSISLNKVEFSGNRTFTGGTFTNNKIIPCLGANRESVMDLPRIFGIPPHFLKSADLYVAFTYHPYLIPLDMTSKMRFKVNKKADGTYVWLQYFSEE